MNKHQDNGFVITKVKVIVIALFKTIGFVTGFTMATVVCCIYIETSASLTHLQNKIVNK